MQRIAVVIAAASAISPASRMPTTRPRTASCACGSVVLHVNVSTLQTVHCHCRSCRRSTGAAFSTWGCVPLAATYFSQWQTLSVYQRSSLECESRSPRANRYFCSKCGCSVAMTYPATGRWPEPHSLWLSAAFLGDEDAGINVIHMYPEERPGWCDIDRQGCDDQPLSYMGDDHVCELPDDEDRAFALVLGGSAGVPQLDPAHEDETFLLPPSECFRLRGLAPAPPKLPGSAALALEAPPDWARSGRETTTVEATTVADDFRVRTIDVAGTTVSIFEVADPTSDDGCDTDSPRSAMCGGVLWPGSRAAAEAIAEMSLAGCTILEIGAGTGLCSLAAASMGAAEVVATDASPGVLELIEAAAAAQDLGVVRTQVFDFLGDAAASPVRGVDIAVAADLLYTEEITRAVARTCAALKTGGAAVIVTDSQRRHRDAFLDELDRCLPRADREFEATTVSDYTGWSYPDAGDVSVEAITVGVLRLM